VGKKQISMSYLDSHSSGGCHLPLLADRQQ
jgi:hypothetical protein